MDESIERKVDASKFTAEQKQEIEDIQTRLNHLSDSLERLVIDEEKRSKMTSAMSVNKRSAAIEKLRSEVDRQQRALEDLMEESARLNRERDTDESGNYIAAASAPFPYELPGHESMKFYGGKVKEDEGCKGSSARVYQSRYDADVYCPYNNDYRGYCMGDCVYTPHHWAPYHNHHHGHIHGCASGVTGYFPYKPCYHRSGHCHNHGAHHCFY
jgi:hypothetical protein